MAMMDAVRGLVTRLLFSVFIPASLIVASLYIFNSLGEWPILVATVVAFAIGYFIVYLAFRYWIDTSTDHDTPQQQMMRFMIVFVITIAINTEMVYLTVTYTPIDLLTAQTVAAVAVAYMSFFAYRSLVFKVQQKKTTVTEEMAGNADKAAAADTRPADVEKF
jgi:putative flippase GtrA